MILLLLHLLRLLPFLFGGHRHFALENLALRHQLAVSDGRRSRRSSARSSRFPKSVACIIATSAGRRSPTPVSLHRHRRARSRSSLLSRRPSSARISSHRESPTARECRQPCLLSVSSAWSLSAEHRRASSKRGLSSRSLPGPRINHPRSKRMRFWRRTGVRRGPPLLPLNAL